MSETTNEAAREQSQRSVLRLFGAAAASAISKTEKSLDDIGLEVGRNGRWVRRTILRLLDGKPVRLSMRDFSAFLFACGCEADIQLLPHQEQAQ